MGKEVEMQDAPATQEPEKKGDEGPAPPTISERLRANVSLIEKAVRQKETRAVFGKLLRQTTGIRRQLTAKDLHKFLGTAVPHESAAAQTLRQFLGPQEADGENGAATATPETTAVLGSTPEVEMYAYLLVLMFLVDHKQYDQTKSLATVAVERLAAFNRRTLDAIAARVYFYLSLAHEKTDTLAEIRSQLLALHRTAVLRHDDIGQETLLNLLLRNYLHYNLYDQAEKLRSKAQRPEQSRSSQQYARYLYYLGRIRAIQLEYTDAKDCLQQAARKAPPAARGFRVTVHKWLVLVRLLLGEIPERTEFTAPELEVPLRPYFEVTQAVRAGDLHEFSRVAQQYEGVFRADRTLNLIVRLRHNVIRAGLRRINLAYSRISLADVAAKLGLASVEDTESILAKAIRDGGIDAVINHEGGYMESAKPTDIYATDEPRAAYHARIAFCMDIHNEAIKAMRFEPKSREDYEEANKLKERQEQELQAALGDEDGFDGI
ncbi:hypothetical protein N2152v2_003202 [Parachlorella kessleri]